MKKLLLSLLMLVFAFTARAQFQDEPFSVYNNDKMFNNSINNPYTPFGDDFSLYNGWNSSEHQIIAFGGDPGAGDPDPGEQIPVGGTSVLVVLAGLYVGFKNKRKNKK